MSIDLNNLFQIKMVLWRLYWTKQGHKSRPLLNTLLGKPGKQARCRRKISSGVLAVVERNHLLTLDIPEVLTWQSEEAWAATGEGRGRWKANKDLWGCNIPVFTICPANQLCTTPGCGFYCFPENFSLHRLLWEVMPWITRPWGHFSSNLHGISA